MAEQRSAADPAEVAQIKGEAGRTTLVGPAAEKHYLAQNALLKYAVLLMVSGQLLGDIYQNY